MKISGATLIKNAIKLDYPIIESVNSLFPHVDEYVINLGDSEDNTNELVRSWYGGFDNVKMFDSKWEGKEQGMTFFRNQTNKALDACTGDWIFYLQADEAIHDDDAKRMRAIVEEADKNGFDAIAFNFLHFEKNYNKTKKTYSEGFDAYEKEIRLIKNNKQIRSVGDAMSFGGVTKVYMSDMNIFHYGYVKDPKTMLEKKLYLKEFYFNDPSFTEDQKVIENGKIRSVGDQYKFSRNLNDFTGTHPMSMRARIESFNQRNPELLT